MNISSYQAAANIRYFVMLNVEEGAEKKEGKHSAVNEVPKYFMKCSFCYDPRVHDNDGDDVLLRRRKLLHI